MVPYELKTSGAQNEPRVPPAPTHSTPPSLTLDYEETIAVLRAVHRIPHQGRDGLSADHALRELIDPLLGALLQRAIDLAPSVPQLDRDCAAAFRCRPKREKPQRAG